MAVYTDQTGRSMVLDHEPRRIISLVPSQTELLHDLGLEEQVAGITKFCVHPQAWFHSKPKIGGTKQVKVEAIHQLQPDLIIANKEENVKEQVEELARHYPVWTSDVNTLEDAYDMIAAIGNMTGKEAASAQIIRQITESFSRLPAIDYKLRTCYLIWREPYMTVGGDTFIHAMLEAAGFENIFQHRRRYPELSVEEVKEAGCEWLLLSSEPYPFRQKHVEELQALLPGTRILLVDGELFSWYGSRLLLAPDYFNRLRQQGCL
ncbi:MAG: helical backbone metal receptor [Chitinophagaceae bacterium]